MRQFVDFRLINMRLGYIADRSYLTLIGNIVLFIPIGYFLNNFVNLNIIKKYILFLLFIITLEVSQYIFGKGCLDINDVIINVLGFSLGYYLKYKINKFSLTMKKKH